MKIDPQVKKEIKTFVLEGLRKEKNRNLVITTPYPLIETDLQFLFDELPELKKYTIKNAVEKNIIGGMIVQHKSKIIDISIKSKIDETVKRLIAKV